MEGTRDGAHPRGMACATTPATRHVVEAREVFDGLEEPLRVPRPPSIERDHKGRPATGWCCPGMPPVPVGRLGIAGNRLDDPKTDERDRPRLRRASTRASWTRTAASTSRTSTASCGEVMYPSLNMFTFAIPDRDVAKAVFERHNDWVLDYCSAAPERLIGIGCLPIPDVDDALAEMKRAADAGRAGLRHPRPRRRRTGPTATPTTTRSGPPRRTIGVPLTMHIFTGTSLDGGMPKHWGTPGGTIKGYTFAHTDRGQHDDRPHLRRRRASASPACGSCSASSRPAGWRTSSSGSTTPPTARRSTRSTTSRWSRRSTSAATSRSRSRTTRPVSRTRDLIGVDSLLWGNDYPHHDAIWPHSMRTLDRVFADVPHDEREQMVWSNTVELYGIDTTSSPPPPDRSIRREPGSPPTPYSGCCGELRGHR